MTGVMACENMIKAGFGMYLLPNAYNISLNFPFLMKYVVTTIYAFMLPFNYSYLLKQRARYYAAEPVAPVVKKEGGEKAASG